LGKVHILIEHLVGDVIRFFFLHHHFLSIMTEITPRSVFNEINASNYKAWITHEENLNISVLSQKIRSDIRHWLENPNDKPRSTESEKQKQYNIRQKALTKFEFYRDQIYRKAETITYRGKRIQLDACLAIC
jgi:hypothetical protein